MIFQYLSDSDHYVSFDFESVSKLIFDSVVEHIQPSNIYALTLSNSNGTVGQIELFLSY